MNGNDDDERTWTSFYEELLAEREFSDDGRGPRWLALVVVVICCVATWATIILLVRSCMS